MTCIVIMYGIVVRQLHINPNTPSSTSEWGFIVGGNFGMSGNQFLVWEVKITKMMVFLELKMMQYIVHPENLEAGNSSGHVTDLRYERAQVILGVTLRTTSTKSIGRESVCWRGRKHQHNQQLQENIPRRVTPQWCVKSNKRGYFYNVSPGTRETCSRE